MKFIYDPKIDEQCAKWIAEYDTVFDEKKRTETYSIDKDTVNKFEEIWTKDIEEKFNKGMFEIFKVDFPVDFTCYINRTPYSMDINEGISISVSALNNSPILTICHEANHFVFRRSNYKNIYFPKNDIEDAKEIFVSVNNLYFKNIMENQDLGWPKFREEIKTFLEVWKSKILQ